MSLGTSIARLRKRLAERHERAADPRPDNRPVKSRVVAKDDAYWIEAKRGREIILRDGPFASRKVAREHLAETMKKVEEGGGFTATDVAKLERKEHAHSKLKSPRVKLLGRRGRLRIYRVDDTKVRLIHSDWTMGGHDRVYDFIPALEVWIAGELGPPRPPLEERLTQLHELRERRRMGVLMAEGKTRSEAYEIAHNESLDIEDKYRRAKGRGLVAALRREQGQ